MRLLFLFIRAYPLQSTITLGALLFAGLIEGMGLALLLPLVSIAVGGNSTESPAAISDTGSNLEQIITEFFGALGITPSIGLLLVIFVACMLVKAVLKLIANKQVGYTVAQVLTDLRLQLVHALFETRWEYFISERSGKLTNSKGSEAGRSSRAYRLIDGKAVLVTDDVLTSSTQEVDASAATV